MYIYIVTVMVFELPPFIIFSQGIGSASPHGSPLRPNIAGQASHGRGAHGQIGEISRRLRGAAAAQLDCGQDGARWPIGSGT